jgi:hypothetical protein
MRDMGGAASYSVSLLRGLANQAEDLTVERDALREANEQLNTGINDAVSALDRRHDFEDQGALFASMRAVLRGAQRRSRALSPGEAESNAHRHVPAAVDVIAQAIRVADGNHRLGAGALGAVAVKALREAGYTLMRPVCEACDDGFAS